ncbi:uncharacterized protein LOC141855934 [Brevipalpus obovatus]|uniref:uncharacterized protein LOC141855934 n=1 Tax=Brevipalpus obovatus TaxID=246614 RepID=UPI003D9F03E3
MEVIRENSIEHQAGDCIEQKCANVITDVAVIHSDSSSISTSPKTNSTEVVSPPTRRKKISSSQSSIAHDDSKPPIIDKNSTNDKNRPPVNTNHIVSPKSQNSIRSTRNHLSDKLPSRGNQELDISSAPDHCHQNQITTSSPLSSPISQRSGQFSDTGSLSRSPPVPMSWTQKYLIGKEASVRRRRTCARLKKCVKSFLAHLFSTAGLCSLTFAYSIAGAFLISLFDNDPNRVYNVMKKVQNQRKNLANRFWSKVENYNLLNDEQVKNDSISLLIEYEEFLLKTIKQDSYDLKYQSVNDTDFNEWPFAEALLFSVTVITTIGYGNKAPKTWTGRLFTMVYALFGIPIMLLCVSNLGNIMANTFRFSYRKICCCCIDDDYSRQPRICLVESLESGGVGSNSGNRKQSSVKMPVSPLRHNGNGNDSIKVSLSNCRSLPVGDSGHNLNRSASIIRSEPLRSSCHNRASRTQSMVIMNPRGWEAKKGVPIWLVMTIVLTYMTLGGYLFTLIEPESFENMFVGAYFCFITLSTIGFGDIVPGKFTELRPSNSSNLSNSKADSEQEAKYQLIICCCYLFSGLALIAMSFNLVQESIREKFRRFVRVMGVLKES